MSHSKFKYAVLFIILLGLILIHVDVVCFADSVFVRHAILIFFVGVTGYLAYESRRHHLEEYNKLKQFLRVCAWCKKICITDADTGEEKWLSFEEYMVLEHKAISSHGICPECLHLVEDD